MSYIQDIFRQVTTMHWSDYLDIIIVAYLLYRVFLLVRNTGTMRVAAAVVTIIIVASLTKVMKLHTLSFILDQFMQIGLLAVVVLFQPELRRMLEHLGSVKVKKLFVTEKPTQEMVPVIAQTVIACETMSRERVGALIVFERDSRLDDCGNRESYYTGTAIQVGTF